MLEDSGRLARKRVQTSRVCSLLVLLTAGIAGLTGAGCSSGVSTASQFIAYAVNGYFPAAGTSSQNGEVTIYVGSTYLAANMAFGQVGSSGNPVSLTSGTYNVYGSLYHSNTTFTEDPLVTFGGSNTPYTIIAAGEAGQTGTYKPQIIVMPNYITSPLTLSLTGSQSAVRIVNISLNPNPIGLYSTTAGVPTTPVTGLASSYSFGYSIPANNYVAVDTTLLHNLALVDSTAPTVALSLPNTNVISNLNTEVFASGSAYTLIIYGQTNNAAAYQTLGATWVQDYPIP